ncbi:MAG: hypothetical protein AVO35_10365 [Candidatus Aegiribacteria sp. MLS_C]|nr:MAG: hypothetical protein AVO35_10365 [Candidatus Aegiribacteria sp. MLS_C]
MTFAPGALVRTRGREWVVLPESSDELLILRPLGGTDEEVAGVYLPLEIVEPAHFGLPDSSEIGDYRSCNLLREAVRIGFRNSAGPFRSFGKLSVQPRSYQLVPLLMALKLDPVRMLIADDVGIGKTIEALLIVREMLDSGDIHRFTVLCPSHLAEQWQSELSEKFNIEAALVLPGTVRKLESRCSYGESVFDRYPVTVVSVDYIKSERHRNDFKRACPEMVIVDEAHGCASGGVGQRGRHQRHTLIKDLSSDSSRHMILVTATPHSGKEEAFRSLLKFLRPDFSELPEVLTGKENERHRRELAKHFVQRTRGDIIQYLDERTFFPERLEKEESYHLHPDYKKFFNRVLTYTRESVTSRQKDHRYRVRYWSALALLRALASSPAAAAATLRTRAGVVDTENVEEADEIGRRTVLDMDLEAGDEALDVIPGSEIDEFADDPTRERRRLLEFARDAEKLAGKKDLKLQKAAELVKSLIRDDFKPIIFCRFINTAEYVASQLKDLLPNKVEVACVTGHLPPTEREERVKLLAESDPRVLVCTDCLSEGINLQDWFDAVLHYDLSWNPMRHEQRSGRVDRFGQRSETVNVVTYYGADNVIDVKVLEVLLRKHRTIRSTLGISVPVPARTNEIIEALVESLLSSQGDGDQMVIGGFEEYMARAGNELFQDWEEASEREKRSRTIFAQETIKPEIVDTQLRKVRASLGSQEDTKQFFVEAIQSLDGRLTGDDPCTVRLEESPRALRDNLGCPESFRATFEFPPKDGVDYLSRTHPYVENLASFVLDSALDPTPETRARRCGAIRTRGVSTRTTLLLLRFRYHLRQDDVRGSRTFLAEDSQLMAFEGEPSNPQWLSQEDAEKLIHLKPDDNTPPDQARHFVQLVLDQFKILNTSIEARARKRAEKLLEAHREVRSAARMQNVQYEVEPKLPADLIGVYVYLPVGGSS